MKKKDIAAVIKSFFLSPGKMLHLAYTECHGLDFKN